LTAAARDGVDWLQARAGNGASAEQGNRTAAGGVSALTTTVYGDLSSGGVVSTRRLREVIGKAADDGAVLPVAAMCLAG
jgi:hypothetical protein